MGSVNSLAPNTIYVVEVEAMDNALNVLSTAVVEEVTAPDVPTIEQAYSKQSDSITVEFSAVPGASSYILRAESATGEFFSETPVSASPGTMLHLQPYTDYILSVMSVNSGGMSQPSVLVEVKTVVAAPELDSTSSSNSTILLTWDRVEHAVLYTLCIIMEGSDTRVKLNTTNTSVAFMDLEAGTTYCIKGNAWDPHSILGEDFTVCQITRPPTPGLVQAMLTVDGSQDMTVHWETMHGADRYLALSTTGQNCTSSDNYCVISPLSCGQNHSITVTALNRAGPSGPSEPEDFLTFPCPPESIWVEEPVPGKCTVLWSMVPWVEYYKAFVKRDDGSEELCNTTSNTCDYHCQCGFTYFMNVFAYNRAGSSPPGHVLNYTTIPCCPEDVSISLVSTETLEISWSPVRGAEVYETKAAGTSDLIHCNDTAPVCALSNLRCNTRYSVVVWPCSELRGCNNTCRPHTEETAPCTPEIVSITQTDVSCVNISWSASNKEANYTVNIVGEMDSHTCHSTGTSCEVPHLPCGSTYEVSSFASTSVGQSLPSYTSRLETGPCCPQVLKVTQVTQAMTNITWSKATGAESYVTSLTSPRGDAKCHTLETHCLMGCITCGTNYTVSVEAVSSTGHKSECTYHGFSSSACCPSSVKLYRMTNNTIRVYWRSSGNLNNYTADLYGANSNYTCTPLPGGNSCHVSEIMCGDVYTVVVAPLSQDGAKIKFCPKRMYSEINNLQPSTAYDCTVYAFNVAGLGASSKVRTVITPLSPVTSLSVDYSCSTSSVTVMWGTVFGADSYRAAAIDSKGTVLSCTSEAADCQITGVSCGERYMVRVTSISDNCESTANATTYFETVPCAPTNLTLERECSSNLIVFRWEPTNHTQYYLATAVDSNGGSKDCATRDTECYFDHTFCGLEYTFTVYSVSEDCKSEVSAPVSVRTAPCAAKNLKTTVECNSDVLISTWNMAPGALSYTVEALGNAENHTWYNCSSFTNSCAMPGVHCGESLTVRIISSDNQCHSHSALGEVAETVPCVPQNVTAVKDCSSDSVTVNWEFSHGAIFYVASAAHADGTVHTCSAVSTRCSIQGLRCGQTYSAFVLATNLKCNSSDSARVTVETAPCPPDHIEALLDCAANQALVSWQSQLAGSSYTATIEDKVGGLLSCMATGNSCTIADLKCGQEYAVSVTRHSSKCPSMPSDSIRMHSVPCGPKNMQCSVDCGTGVLDVSWDVSVEAEGYTASVTSSNGDQIYRHNSTDARSSFDSLECGRPYTVTVKSVNGTCLSMASRELIREVPCVPTNVTAERSCGDSSVEVTWEASQGARYYNAVAVGYSGHTAQCSSNGTACSIPDLRCSQVYTVGVVAVDDNCTSLQSQTVTLHTVPCSPSNPDASIDCATNAASVSWDASPNAASYLGRAVGTDGHAVTCNGSAPGCQMSGLHCGQEYAFTVSATDGTCQSPGSTEFTRVTAPCVLESVRTHIHCHSNVLMVSWNASAQSLNYSAIVRMSNGTEHSCSSTGPSCDIDRLSCGQQCSVTVTASNHYCSGPASAAQAIQTVPCVPQNLIGLIECSNNDLTASWSISSGASSYTATVSGPGGYSESCSTPGLTCSFSSLLCAQQYSVSVVAQDRQCNSTAGPAFSTATGPCEPENVATTLHCQTNVLLVSWDRSAGAGTYTVLAEHEEQPLSSCKTADTSCQLRQLQCGEMYNITVLTGDGTCRRSAEPHTVIKTAPCPPVIEHHTVDCATNIASLSWGSDDDMVGFVFNGTSTLGLKTSCSTTNTSCELSDLQCGQTYTLHGAAFGKECQSEPSPGVNIVTAPCTPAMVNSHYDCGTNIALVSWDDSQGRETFQTYVEGDGHMDSCTTARTTCDFTSLRCGMHYNVTVNALASLCNSSYAVGTSFHTAPCAPLNVSASLMCANNTAVVTWAPTSGAVSYSVDALGKKGDTKFWQSTNTSCVLPMMQCGEEYAITVTPYSETCSGFASEAIVYTAGPCPPNNVEVTLECEGNIGSVSWESVIGAEMYLATARAEYGHEHTCNSTSTSCSFTDLLCGETYSITVVTYMRGCYSDPSPGKNLKTAICPPINLVGQTSCETNILMFMWDPSPEVGVTYFLVTEKEGGASTTYRTADTSYFIFSTQCGEHYSVRLITQDSICNSSLSPPLEQDTAPCPPSNLATSVDCGTRRGNITWAPGTGGETYVAEAVGSHGHRVSCSTNSTSCSVKLDCGRHYTATVISSNDICNSTMDAFIQFDSAPCLPGNVVAELNCSSNEFAVQWQASMGSETYTALAIGSDGYRVSCNTSGSACTIADLRCGLTYSIAVTTSSVQCGQIQGSDYMVQSAPCLPANPEVIVDCGTNMANVSWDYRAAQQTNVVTAVERLGQTSTCNTTNSSCTFDQLSCGEAYSFSIVGVTDQCRTATSSTAEHRTAPCIPSHVEAHLDCNTGIALVTWDSARGAAEYSVLAYGSLGHGTSCWTTDTLCSMDYLRCGQDYSITVTAHHDSCNGQASEAIVITTGPCPHADLEASRDCASNSAAISWTPGLGTVLYNASAESLASGHQLSCSTNGSACNISSLQCGERYRVSVEGQGLACISRPGSWVPVNTAPCPPTQVTTLCSCGSSAASVSWEAAKGAVRYVAAAEDSGGNVVSCGTSGTACNLTGLSCGRTYNVSVTALDEECVGGRSESHTLTTAAVETNLVCQSGLLSVAWQQSDGALLYHAVVRSSSGQSIAHVMVNATDFSTDLPCGDTYNVTVYASDEVCNSSHSPAKLVTAAPCPPVSITTVVDCATSITSVFWDSVHGVVYTVKAMEAGGHCSSCNTTDSNCALTNLHCGTVYNVTLSGSLDGCMGGHTSVYTIRTVPCVPVLTEVEIDCLSESSAWVVWEESVGAEQYTVTAEDSRGSVSQCATNDSTCSVPDLHCGQHYTFTVAASDRQCTSGPSNQIMTDSEPCAPQGVRANVGCENMTASIYWDEGDLVLTYTATLEHTDGETTCCTTAGTSCRIADLPCGEMYGLTVSAEGRTCNSSQSPGILIRTVPCTPQNLAASVSCSSAVATATWNSSRGGQMYFVEASGTDGHSVTCNSHKNSCDLDTLRCGQSYNVSIVAADSSCNSAEPQPAEFKTVPCVPRNVSADVDCESNSVSVSWGESAGADSYRATLEDSDGRSTDCQVLGANSCNITGLNCGKTYRVTVAASDGYCTSAESQTTDAQSVPCPASRIEATMDCRSQTAFVSWHFSVGALSYTATMEAESGHAVTCSTNFTNCDMSGLACGERYSVSVRAEGEICSRTAQMEGSLQTEPCVPLNLDVQYSLSIGQLIWDMSKGATYYSAEAITREGLRATCNTTETNCVLYDMACSQIYNITITAHNQACRDIATSVPITLVTEPCAPGQVEAHVSCETGGASVSWEMSEYAMGYQAFLEGQNGHSTSCYSTDTFCNVDNLDCGTAYYVRVRALGEMFNSTDSSSIVLTAAPCVPDSVEAEVDCVNDSALVTWSFSDGAASYAVSATGIGGNMASCSTEDNFCRVTDLSCGETYNLSLTSINEQCNVLSLTGLTIQTKPCAPLRVAANFECGSNTAILSWAENEGVELYVANATKSNGEYAASCNSTGSTCLVSNLDCGETYSFTVTAHSSQCQSELSNTVEITTEPCGPGSMSAVGSCGNDTVNLAWEESPGASVYIVTATGDLGYVTGFNTTDTSLEASLPCGQTFSFSVVARGHRCDSPHSGHAHFTTAPCVPQYVETYVQCEDSVGSVSWMGSDGAESYTAVAVGQDKHTHMCTTNGTTCTWSDLHCAEIYTVHVIANDYLCTSVPSNGTVIHMAPCMPQNLVSTLDCDMKVGTLTWEASEGADLYIVTAIASNGHKMEVTTNITSSLISEFGCGLMYYLTVKAVGPMCISVPSSASSLQTEPCAPTVVTTQLDCLTNILLVEWDSAEGAEYYTATAQGEDGQEAVCMASTTECSIASLPCAQNYTVSVTASNANCSSDPIISTGLRSAPCIPTDVAVHVDCADNTARVSWNQSEGALSYRVVAERARGDPSSCESSVPHCDLANLACGTNYTVWVVAVDSSCTTIPSERVLFQSVPCTPEISAIHLDCFTNSVLVEWGYGAGASFYTGVAESSGDTAVCNTNHTNCEIMDLECGQVYTVRIASCNGNCNSSLSEGWEVASVPCAPQSVVSQLDCATNSAHVTWEEGSGAESYTVHAIGWEGTGAECNSTELACVLPDLTCGCPYNVSVVAVSQQCNVSESQVTLMPAVPCVPKLVEAAVNCESGVVSVSWEQSDGAVSYTVIAQGNGGYASSCNTSGTVCQFDDLLCGTTYGVTVGAADDTCSSERSSVVHVDTVACEPQNVSAAVNCSSTAGLVTWEHGEGAASYHVWAAGADGHLTHCNSTSAGCQLPGLRCGQSYNLTVAAQDGQCDTSRAYLSLQSVPCEPRNVQAALQCLTNSASVTWERGSGALSYQATGAAPDGHTASCNTSATHCDLEALQCGQSYAVSVLSLDESCRSAESVRSQVRTAPCPPVNVEASISCDSAIMMVMWDPNEDADSFRAEALSDDGQVTSCDTEDTFCSIANVPCGHAYQVRAVSLRDGCESAHSVAASLSSAPCVPQDISGNLDCVTNYAWVSWKPAMGAHTYTVTADGVGGYNSSCSTTDTTCNVPDLRCGVLYTFHVTASNHHCQSSPTDTFQIETAPCALTAITAVTECHSDTIQVRWEQTGGSPLFIATAEGNDRSMLSCNSTMATCNLIDAQCGTHYTIIVAASSDKCTSLRSPPYRLSTAPCAPQNVSFETDCEGKGVVVSWDPSFVADSYLLTAEGKDGDLQTCNTTVSNCTLLGLQCGQPYSFTVTASSQTCTSPDSAELTFNTVPCDPGNLRVELQCASNSAVLSWNASEGSVEYFACAQDDAGDMLYCNGTDSSCVIDGLECGTTYNFSVQASDGVCKSLLSEPLLQGAVPCPPDHLETRMLPVRGADKVLRVSWQRVLCPQVNYLVEVTGSILGDSLALLEVDSYWTARNFFEIPLPCSSKYSVTVRSGNLAGDSEPSEAISGPTVPCPPQDITYTGNTTFAIVSWNASIFATEYHVYELFIEGAKTEVCRTTLLFCELNAVYASELEITASNRAGESSPSNIENGQPSHRSNLMGAEMFVLNENGNLSRPQVSFSEVTRVSLVVVWEAVTHATYYTLRLTDPAGDLTYYTYSPVVFQETYAYTVTNLEPDTTYCISVSAKSVSDSSPYSLPTCVNTVA
ncbi:hypothetical protein SKAU_G00067410 [Synaphobranchus kaupii]|uniref:Fibronectin type-III domain-containing protein n=1 Tax=Synaphobranchus kaupii TaxID=118154 RepID=A0A9Q1G705_SYNKA|nr:hypothetical protein SKAU_G00067410 [Synaphobranchus kaupii]